MKPSTLAFLLCPTCHVDLSLVESHTGRTIESGGLTCPKCLKIYPIVHGIPRFIEENQLVGLNKRFARMYDWFSWIYSAFSKVGFLLLGTSDSRARQDLMSLLEPSGRVLEVSIGPGVNLPFLFNYSGVTEVYGLDISIGQLNRCRSRVRRKGYPVELVHGNGEDLPIKDNSFDSVFHVGGINFFSQQQKAIDEMIRVAKPGTRIIICDENEAGAEWYEKLLPGFKSAFHGQRQKIIAPVDLVPETMLDLKSNNIWNDFMYCLEFRKPYSTI